MSRKKSRKKSADAKILQKLNEIDREFKSMERFRLSMVKSRKARIMKRIKKGEPADYKGYKKELTARIKTHLTRVNKSIKAYSKILKKSRKPRKKKSGHKKSRKPRKKKSVKKKSKRKKMKMCGCGIDVHFRMKKFRVKVNTGARKTTYQQRRQQKFMRPESQKKRDLQKALKARKLRQKQKRIEAIKKQQTREDNKDKKKLVDAMAALNVGANQTTSQITVSDLTSSLGSVSLKTQ
jgi:hypothetical protein